MEETYFAFIDEAGNENLDTEINGVSDFFIITAVLVPESGLELAHKLSDSIRNRHFQTGEIKSSSIGDKHTKRVKILKDIAAINIKYTTLIVDKNKIDKTSGLSFKKVFRKYLPGMLYQSLFKTHKNLTIINDEHGSINFMKSVELYVKSKIIPSLLPEENYIFSFKSSKDEVLIQISDFIAGTWAKIADKTIPIDVRNEFKNIIRSTALSIEFWPPSHESFYTDTNTPDHLDKIIRNHCYTQAQIYIEANTPKAMESTEDGLEERLRVEILKFLLLNNEIFDSEKFAYSDKIIKHLKTKGIENLNRRRLAAQGISILRRRNVIISSGKYGYKLPTKLSDIEEFISTSNEKIVPMLERITDAYHQINRVSHGRIDILSEHPELITLVKALQDHKIESSGNSE
jgi:hypothetical protein